MKPLFTIHAGEFLVGNYIESQFRRRLNVWIPSRDTGIDLLVTDRANQRTTSLQVKFSRDFLHGKRAELRPSFRCHSWFKLDRANLDRSRPQADFWVFVLHAFRPDKHDFLIVPTADLRKYVLKSPASAGKVYLNFSSTRKDRCWETRQLKECDWDQISDGSFENLTYDFTQYLNKWDRIVKKLHN
jgi:hypothetical protein